MVRRPAGQVFVPPKAEKRHCGAEFQLFLVMSISRLFGEKCSTIETARPKPIKKWAL